MGRAMLSESVPVRAVMAARSKNRLGLVRFLSILVSDCKGCKADGRQRGADSTGFCHTNVPMRQITLHAAVVFGMPASAAQRYRHEVG